MKTYKKAVKKWFTFSQLFARAPDDFFGILFLFIRPLPAEFQHRFPEFFAAHEGQFAGVEEDLEIGIGHSHNGVHVPAVGAVFVQGAEDAGGGAVGIALQKLVEVMKFREAAVAEAVVRVNLGFRRFAQGFNALCLLERYCRKGVLAMMGVAVSSFRFSTVMFWYR